MESYSYVPTYPDSGDSSPRSREIDFENPAAWEDPLNPQTPSAYKIRFMCSYGGKIHPRPHDNQLSYVSGETKILVVDRNIKFSALLAKLSGLCDNDNVSFKYQLPGEDLDALISVTTDEDLENMLQEYDRLYKASPKPARLRLFLFGANPSQPAEAAAVGNRSFGSEEEVTTKSEKERFVEALNSGPIQAPPPLAAVPQPPIPAGNADFLFGLEKEMAPPPPPQQQRQQQQEAPVVVIKSRDSQQTVDTPMHEHDFQVALQDGKIGGSDPIQKHIQDLQKLRIEAQQQQQAVYRRKSDDNLSGGFPVSAAGDFYQQNLQEKVPLTTIPANVAVQQGGGGYWTEKQVHTGVFPVTEPLYMIPPTAGAYPHPQMVRQVTGPTGQGYYQLQRMPPEAYRDQQLQYNIVPSMAAAPPPQPNLPPPAKVTAYTESFGVVRPAVTSGGVGTMEPGAGYAQVAYDGGIGRQVYYTAQGVMGGPPPPLPQQQQAAAAAAAQYHHAIATGMSGDVKALNQEAVKAAVAKATQASV